MFPGGSLELRFSFLCGSMATSRVPSGGPTCLALPGHPFLGIFSPRFPNCVDVELVPEAPGPAAIHRLRGSLGPLLCLNASIIFSLGD